MSLVQGTKMLHVIEQLSHKPHATCHTPQLLNPHTVTRVYTLQQKIPHDETKILCAATKELRQSPKEVEHLLLELSLCICYFLRPLLQKSDKLKKVGETTRPFRYDVNQIIMIIQWK